ncbi:hypothetical protein [Pseudocitrobacter vendiensis]|uniref:Uncharacterized protein n=1 Tax=Pseudocitrobacter vendiensis TaxID=2488306 RepID=A0ABM9F9R3_9ENTR|nr:hypothetical protein [Pseudocitrobacter vendiensis]CAH6659902.1 hypothetical protein FBBNIHIM_12315 [Pseudocitrobacter vendiensis]
MLTNREFNSLSADQQQKLFNLLNYITHDDPRISKAKRLLVAGMTPQKVCMLLDIPLDRVEKLHREGWNPRCRQQAKPKQAEVSAMLQQAFQEGADLKTLCERFDLPLYTITQLLKRSGVSSQQLAGRMPEPNEPLYREYLRTVERHENRKQKAPTLH